MRVVQLERRAGAGSRKRFAVSNPAASRFAAQNLRLIHFCEHFTTDATDFFEQKETKATKRIPAISMPGEWRRRTGNRES
jgi:hypothetical protein